MQSLLRYVTGGRDPDEEEETRRDKAHGWRNKKRRESFCTVMEGDSRCPVEFCAQRLT